MEGKELRYTSISPTAASLLKTLSIYVTVLKERNIQEIKLVYVGLFEILCTDKQKFDSKCLLFLVQETS